MKALAALCVVSLSALAGCRDPARLVGTAVLVTTETASLEVDQLRYEGLLDGGAAFDSATRPEPAAGLVPSSTTVRVLLPDELTDQLLEVRVVGLRNGVVSAEGSGRVQLEAGVERHVTVRLLPPAWSCASCPGCCATSGACVSPSASACGSPGTVCLSCDITTADQCGADGRCRCGAGPPCTDASGGDRCLAGACHCGDGAACGAGLECLQRACQCTAASCGGCCQAGRCITAPTSAACGTGGAACLDCGASACSGGQCVSALCSAANCPSGCCAGAQCLNGRETNACGAGGRACSSCGQAACDAGVCAQRCGPTNCRGCCVNGACVGGTADLACGKDGATCRNCNLTDDKCRSSTCR